MSTAEAPHVALIVLHWGPVEVTARCLRSLAEMSFRGRTTVFLIDNTGRLDPSFADSLAPLAIEIHRSERNLGFARGCARGIALALERGADFILLLNNDVTVEASFLDALLGAARQLPGAGVWCPQIVSMADPRRIWYAGGAFSLWSGIPTQEVRLPSGAALRGQPRDVDYATGCAMLIDPAVVRAVGSFDPEFFMYCEDLDFSLRARRAGFRIVFVPASLVQHAVMPDNDREPLRVYYSTRNLLRVMRRHAAWYQWPGFVVNFLVRWVGFFTLLACLRRRPHVVRALLAGIMDFAGGRTGEATPSAAGRPAMPLTP